MFVFKPTTQTYSDPVAATFLPGLPFGREKSRGDICLLHDGFASSKIFLNSSVLREAILNSKEYLEEVLDLKITDKLAKTEKVQPKKEKKSAKEAELYMVEEVEQPELVEEVLPTEHTGEEITQAEEPAEPEEKE